MANNYKKEKKIGKEKERHRKMNEAEVEEWGPAEWNYKIKCEEQV